jgi:HK97 family phage major capsid protein
MSTTLTSRERLEAKAAEMRSYADIADARPGGATAEDQATLLQMAVELSELKKAHENSKATNQTLADVTSYLGDLKDVPEGVVKSLADVDKTAAPVIPQAGHTLGELFIGSDAYKGFKDRYAGIDGNIPTSVKGIQSAPFQADTKDLVTGLSSTSAGAAVVNDRYAPITDLVGERELTVADLVTQGSTSSDTVEYVRVTGKTNNASPVVEASAASGTWGIKPESALALEVVSTTVKTIAHWMPITKRAASDAPQVRTLVDNFLRYGLDEELEDQILNGAGTGENFTGILNSSPETVGSSGTDIDAIVDAIRKVRVTGRRRPTAVVMHPNDWFSTSFLLAKSGDGTNSAANYLLGDPRASVDQLNQIWGLRVVITEAMTENTALVGDFRQAVLWRREGVTLTVSDSHSDFFIRNLLAILAEMRAAFGVLDPQAFCTVTSV